MAKKKKKKSGFSFIYWLLFTVVSGGGISGHMLPDLPIIGPLPAQLIGPLLFLTVYTLLFLRARRFLTSAQGSDLRAAVFVFAAAICLETSASTMALVTTRDSNASSASRWVFHSSASALDR